MRLLVLDTALEAVQAAVVVVPAGEGPRVLAARAEAGRGIAERIVELADAVLAEAGLALADLDRIAVTTGPGSFTGVRVALSAARGYTLATGVPSVGVTTLAAFAEAARTAGPAPVLSVVDARHGAVYAALFAPDGTERERAAHVAVADLAARLPAGLAVAGKGAGAVAAALAARGRPLGPVHEATTVDLVAVAALAARAEAPAAPPSPVYLKAPAADPPRPAVARAR